MRNILTIGGRQFRSYFNGPVAYLVICIVMLTLGFFFWKTFFLFGRASAREMFRWLSLILVFALPALTMGLLAEEKRTGTIELLITMPVTEAGFTPSRAARSLVLAGLPSSVSSKICFR